MARQPDTTPKGGGVKALSSRLLQMKFMKRGQGSETATQATSPAVEAQVAPSKAADEEKWVVRTPQSGCIVISEPDPPPGALLGHMTFGGFNPALAQIQEEAEARLREAKRKRESGVVPAQEEAGGTGSMQETAVQSMRMQKRAKQPKR